MVCDPSRLNSLYREYRLGLLERRQFEGLMFNTVLHLQKHYRIFQKDYDAYREYISWLYPRLSAAVDSYRDMGASFSSYIAVMVRRTAREYCTRRTQHELIEHTAWAARSGDFQVRSPEPEYLDEPSPLQADASYQCFFPWGEGQRLNNRRQVLILLLKSYYFVTDDFLERVSPRLGVSDDELFDRICALRSERAPRDQEIRSLQERIHLQFYRCLAFERQLYAMRAPSFHRDRMLARLERARRRLRTMRKRLSLYKFEPSNHQIARVLGIPKGTVDSNLYAIKLSNRKKPED